MFRPELALKSPRFPIAPLKLNGLEKSIPSPVPALEPLRNEDAALVCSAAFATSSAAFASSFCCSASFSMYRSVALTNASAFLILCSADLHQLLKIPN